MNQQKTIELFILKCASLKASIDNNSMAANSVDVPGSAAHISTLLDQFSGETRANADAMADHYRLFYMLENEIRRLIDDTLTERHGTNWWPAQVPNSAKDEYQRNLQRELDAGVTIRSDEPLDYLTFGQLGDIIRHNWDLFGGILSNEKALGRVMFSLNTLRGPIAHCGVLADDEVDRLLLSVKDWFRLLEGPK